jgi:2,4-dienoyl-CoA reductase-like NADH-dependent reductase (Old Yellow Enzyme family)
LSPIKVGPVELKNRIALSPMNETLSDENGCATEEMICYYAARAKGGCGLIISGAIMGTKESSKYVFGRNLHCFRPGHQLGLYNFTERVHYFGAQIFAQMSIGFGRQGHSDDPNDLVPAPTAGLPYETYNDKVPPALAALRKKSEASRLFTYGQMTREMSIDEIHREEREFADGCQIAVKSGFDGIELHFPHGYLEHEFLSPITNKRTDMYGGSWNNRKRFCHEVAEQIRYAAGPDVAVGARISMEEHWEGGLTREEMIDLAKDLQAIGLDFIDLSDGGGYPEEGHLCPDFERVKHWPEGGADFQKALKIPVILPSIHDPVEAEKLVAEGKVSIISLGRALLADAEWGNKVAENRPQDIVKCRRDYICVRHAILGLPPACPFNPNLSREWQTGDYKIGPRKKGEDTFPRGIVGLPVLNRPWWKKEITLMEKSVIPKRGPGPG